MAHTSRFFFSSCFCLRWVRVVGAVEMWESRLLLARFPRGLWKEWEARLWLSTLSTDPAFPQLSFLPLVGFHADRLIRPRSGFPPVDSSWRAPPGNSGCSARRSRYDAPAGRSLLPSSWRL